MLSITSPIYIQGPWDLAVNDKGNSPQIFVANVEDGTVSRIDLKIKGQNIKVQGHDADCLRLRAPAGPGGVLRRTDGPGV